MEQVQHLETGRSFSSNQEITNVAPKHNGALLWQSNNSNLL